MLSDVQSWVEGQEVDRCRLWTTTVRGLLNLKMISMKMCRPFWLITLGHKIWMPSSFLRVEPRPPKQIRLEASQSPPPLVLLAHSGNLSEMRLMTSKGAQDAESAANWATGLVSVGALPLEWQSEVAPQQQPLAMWRWTSTRSRLWAQQMF